MVDITRGGLFSSIQPIETPPYPPHPPHPTVHLRERGDGDSGGFVGVAEAVTVHFQEWRCHGTVVDAYQTLKGAYGAGHSTAQHSNFGPTRPTRLELKQFSVLCRSLLNMVIRVSKGEQA
jgi:hypothetical protein